MKRIRVIMGIVSIAVYSAVISWLYMAGMQNTNNKMINFCCAFLFLFAGMAGIFGRDSKKASIITGVFYVFAGVIGFLYSDSFFDLKIWSVLSFAFGIFFVISAIVQKISGN